MTFNEYLKRSRVLYNYFGVSNFEDFLIAIGFSKGSRSHFDYKGVPKRAIKILYLLEEISFERGKNEVSLERISILRKQIQEHIETNILLEKELTDIRKENRQLKQELDRIQDKV